MKRPLSEKQLAHFERLKASGHYSKAGAKGGLAKYEKYGSRGMAKDGLKGAMKLMERFETEEEKRQFYSEIGSMGKGQGRKMEGR